MTAAAGLRIAVVGATGALGGELLTLLDASPLPVAELRPFATEASLGSDVEFGGEVYAVQSEAPSLHGLDLVFLCAPPAASLDFARQALHAQVPAIDCSGALVESADVPLAVAAFAPAALDAPGAAAAGLAAPLLASPGGATLAWALALRPLAERAGLRRVVGTVLEGAAAGGHRGVETLARESLALLGQTDVAEPGRFERPVAFDGLPAPALPGEVGEDGEGRRERALSRGLARLLGEGVVVEATAVQIPVFLGQGSALWIDTERPLDPKQAAECLAAAPGVDLDTADPGGPTLRAAAGRSEVLVGRLRLGASGALGLWLAADPLRLSADNAVRLAEARLLPR